jgi:ABC-type transport system involved in multi-copper enzyme maturation permease subunit
MNTTLALANLVVTELYRRKDFYVLFVLLLVLAGMMMSVNFFNDPNIVRYLKEICLLFIWVSALIIAITTAARQIPAEREQRTIFPLLAKPVTRAQVIVGKFLGCWFAVGLALVAFYLFFAVVSGSRDGNWPVFTYFQAFWLQWVMLAIVISLVLLGSVVFSAPSANVTICFVIVLGILLLGGYLNQAVVHLEEPRRTIIQTIYFLIPHLEWFDVRDFIVYGWQLVPWIDCLLATLYAIAYSALLLFATWLVFRRKALTV